MSILAGSGWGGCSGEQDDCDAEKLFPGAGD